MYKSTVTTEVCLDVKHCGSHTAGPGASHDQGSALQHPHGDRVRGLDQALHSLWLRPNLALRERLVFAATSLACCHGKRHPHEMGMSEVRAYLSYLAVTGEVAVGTQIDSGHFA